MNYRILRLSDSKDWKKLLSSLPVQKQDIYYSPEYYSLYEKYGDGKAMCFAFESNGEVALYPFLINSVNGLNYELNEEYYDIQGAYGYNGVISSCDTPAFIKSYYAQFEHFCEENRIIAEFTRFHPLLNNHVFSSGYMDLIHDRDTVFIDLSLSEEDIFSGFQKTTKKQIRRCTNRYGIQVLKKEKDISYLDDLIRIYKETMERVSSARYLRFNASYFKNLLLMKGTIQYIAQLGNKPIAIITSIMKGNYMHGHLGGASTEHLHLSSYSLLYWEMIRTAKKRGQRFLNLGGGATTEPQDRLIEYKKHFSKRLSPFYIGKKIHSPLIYKEITKQWENNFPDSYNKHQNKLLGYREI
jgi:hypothetical protein